MSRPVYIRFARLRLISRSRWYCSRLHFVSSRCLSLRFCIKSLCAITKAICSLLSLFSCERMRRLVACRLRTFETSFRYSTFIKPSLLLLLFRAIYTTLFVENKCSLSIHSMQIFFHKYLYFKNM